MVEKLLRWLKSTTNGTDEKYCYDVRLDRMTICVNMKMILRFVRVCDIQPRGTVSDSRNEEWKRRRGEAGGVRKVTKGFRQIFAKFSPSLFMVTPVICFAKLNNFLSDVDGLERGYNECGWGGYVSDTQTLFHKMLFALHWIFFFFALCKASKLQKLRNRLSPSTCFPWS